MRNMTISLASAIALLLSACGGGGGSTAAAPTPAAITVAAVTPATGSTTGIDTAPTISFGAAPDMATVTAKTVSLRSPIGTVDSRLALSGNTVTVTPASPLVWGGHYQLAISDAVRGSASGKLAAATTVSFDTRMPVWGGVATGPAMGTDSFFSPNVSGSPNGDVTMIWPLGASSSSNQFAAMRYSASSQTWNAATGPQGSSALTIGTDWHYSLDVNSGGNACVAWAEDLGDGNYIFKAARFDAANGWTTPVILSASGRSVLDALPKVAIGQNGNIVVSWSQVEGSQFIIYAAYYDVAGKQWIPARQLRSATSFADYYSVAINATGTAMVLWSEGDPQAKTMHATAARYDATAKNWGTAATIRQNVSDESYVVDAAIDLSGNAIVVLTNDSIYLENKIPEFVAARYDAANGTWGRAEPLYSQAAAVTPKIGMDAAGNALLVWAGQTTQGTYTFESSRYQASTNTWSSLSSQTGPLARFAPRMDAAGNGWVAWEAHDGNSTMNAMRYNAAAGKWDAPQVITSDQGYMDSPVMALDQSGQALLIWAQHSGDYQSTARIVYSRLSGR